MIAILKKEYRFLIIAALVMFTLTGCTSVRQRMGVYRFQGKVVDAETHTPVQEARIILDRYGSYHHIEGSRIRTNGLLNEGVTDSQGNFRFDDSFSWEGTEFIFPPLSFGSDIPKPGREVLVILSEGHEPAFFSFRSGWFSNELIRLELSDGMLKEVERVKMDGRQNPTGYRFRFVRNKLKTETSDRTHSGYLFELPIVALKRAQKPSPSPKRPIVQITARQGDVGRMLP